MISILIFIIVSALIDSINPFSIGLQIVLLGLTKKKYHTLYYIFGTFVTYFIGGVIIFLGIEVFLKKYIEGLIKSESILIYFFETIIILILIKFIYKSIKNISKDSDTKEKEITSLNPLTLFALGAGGTLMDIPTSVPYLAFISKMMSLDYNINKVIPYLLVYNLIYLIPMIIILLLNVFFHNRIVNRLEKTKMLIGKINKWVILVFCIVLALILIIDVTSFIIGKPIEWI